MRKVHVPGLTGEVANVVYAAKSKISGQFSYRPEFRAHYADPVVLRGDVSVSGGAGAVGYTISLANNASNSAAGGPTLITRGGALFETRSDVFRGNFNQPQLSGQFKIDGPGSSLGNFNLLGRYFDYRFKERSRRDRELGPDQVRLRNILDQGHNYEIGGDYEFALAGGRLKSIGLNRYSEEPYAETSRTGFSDDTPEIGSRFVEDGKAKELIGRAEYRRKWGRNELQLSGEAAFNSLDNVSALFLLDPGGAFVEVPFPAGSGKVSEDRYEGLVTVGRPLTPKITVQLVAGGEYSTLVQEGPGGKRRGFFRPKGSLNLAAQVTPTFNVNFKAIRRVGQLDFGQFLARVFLENENEKAGNPDLVPTQQWRFELELAKNLGSYGTTKVNLVAVIFEDFIEIIPIGATGESPGNIDYARGYAIDSTSTFQLDPLGLEGARLNLRVNLLLNRIKDPLTGEIRGRSNVTNRLVEIGYRHDIPNGNWAYGANATYLHATRFYRLNEFGRQFEGPVFASLFVENKDVLGLTVRATASNLLDARSRLDRTVYAGRRNTALISFVEARNRLVGPTFSFSIRGTF